MNVDDWNTRGSIFALFMIGGFLLINEFVFLMSSIRRIHSGAFMGKKDMESTCKTQFFIATSENTITILGYERETRET